MKNIDIDLSGMELMTDQALINRGEIKQTPGILEKNDYNPIKIGASIGAKSMEVGSKFIDNFNLGLKVVKTKIKEDDEAKELSKYPLSNLNDEQKNKVVNYTKREQNKNLGYKIWESTSEGFVKAGENISNIEFWRPDEGIIEIVKRGDLDKFEKINESLKVVANVTWNNTLGQFDKDEYLNITGEYANSAVEKIKGGLDSSEYIPLFERSAALSAGTIEFLFAPVGSLFDERNSGAITATLGQSLDSVMIPLRSTIIESTKILGGSEEFGENLSILGETLLPAKIIDNKLKGFNEYHATKLGVEQVKNEIKNLYGLPPEVRESYVAAKKEQYGTFSYVKGVEKFDSLLEKAKIEGNVDLINNLRTQIIEFNKIEKSKIVGNIRNNVGITIDNLADKMGVKLSFIDNGKEIPYLDLSKLSFGKGSDKIHAQELTKKAVNDLSKYWSDKGLGELNKAEITASIDQYFKELGLTEIQKKSFSADLWNELQVERFKQATSVEELYNISQIKKSAENLYRKAKEDFENGNISKQEMLKYKKKYQESLDTYDNPKKLEELKYQEALGNMRMVDDGAPDLIKYEWTDKGLKYLNPKVRSVAVGYHYNRNLKNEVEGKVLDKEIDKIIKTKELDFDQLLLGDSNKIINPLHKAYKKSGETWESFKQKEIEKVINNKEGLYKIQAEIDASKAGERLYLESEIGGSPEVIGLDSTFPKWIPSHLRRKDLMENTFKRLESGNLDIPNKYTSMQELMSVYLKKLNSKLQYIYEADFEKVSSDVWREKTKIQTTRLKQTKQVMNAIHSEYKKVKNEVETLDKKIYESREKLKQTRESWREKFQYKADSNKRRRKAIQTLKKAFELSDNDYKKALAGMEWNRSKDFLTFTHEFEFKEFMFYLEESVFRVADQKFEKILLLSKIESKNLSNVQSLLRAYELPTDINKMSVPDLNKLDKILDQFEDGDNFITSGLIKRFEILGEDIKTIREARESIAKDLGDLYELMPEDFEESLYKGRINEIKQELKESIDSRNRNRKEELELELLELEDIVRQEALKKKIKDIDFKKEKTTQEKVKSDKLIKGKVFDWFRYDTAFAARNSLYKFTVLSLKTENIKVSSKIKRLEDKLGLKLRAARDSRQRSLLDKLIPSDELVFEYLEADFDKKLELAKKMTPEELELANFVKEVFNYFRGELTKNKVMDNFMNNYVTNLQKGIAETLKDKGFKAAFKKIFENDESLIDFGALGDPDTVIGFEKFFKFSLQRTKDFDPSKNIGKAVMSYARTYYKKEALDKVIPKVVLYKNLLADSKADKTIVQWLNNKKGITAMPNLQGTGIEKFINGGKSFISFLDLGANPVVAIASSGGVALSNYVGMGTRDFALGVKRKYTQKGREILKKYEAEIGRDPLWNIKENIFNKPDITPLEIPYQASFAMLGQVLQSGMKTAVLGRLTKAEFESGIIEPKRFAEIYNEIGATHALPGTSSIYGSMFIGKLLMMYKSWAPPFFHILGFTKKLADGTITKKEKGMLGRAFFATGTMYLLTQLAFSEEDPNDRFAYHKKRMTQELLSILGALDPSIWTSNRMVDYMKQFYDGLSSLIKLEEYKMTKEGKYEEGDLKGLNQLKRLFSPGWYKQYKILFDGKKTSSKNEINGAADLDVNLDNLNLDNLDLNLDDLNLDNIDINLDNLDLDNLDI